ANGVPAVVADLAGPVDPADLHGGTGQAAGTDGGAVPLRPDAVDVVTAVPPYVPTGAVRLLPTDVQRWEPRRAVDGGADGLDVARLVVAAAGRLLRPGGWLLVELGGEEDRALAPALAAAGFAPGTPWADADGDLRGLAARRTGA
ncbi:MAG TPA: hypothetical protein VF743_04570, partial [Acidimicrobiales bacterium]